MRKVPHQLSPEHLLGVKAEYQGWNENALNHEVTRIQGEMTTLETLYNELLGKRSLFTGTQGFKAYTDSKNDFEIRHASLRARMGLIRGILRKENPELGALRRFKVDAGAVERYKKLGATLKDYELSGEFAKTRSEIKHELKLLHVLEQEQRSARFLATQPGYTPNVEAQANRQGAIDSKIDQIKKLGAKYTGLEFEVDVRTRMEKQRMEERHRSRQANK